ncbi:MAG: hypothetical protein JO033_22290, partial [Acidobacteriaceae bacterium]|nr:hypothetical protein [Acidobacteriaceae bacterium]
MDSRGRYRVFGIPAGTYVVSAATGETAFLGSPSGVAQQDVPSGTYEALYYPGTPLRDDATAIKLSPGEIRENIDFQLAPVRATRLDVDVQLPSGIEGPLDFTASLDSAFENSLIGFGFSTFGSTQDPIRFEEVYPGIYYLRVFAKRGGLPFGAYQRLDVSNEDRSRKVTVQLSPPVDIRGSIHIESSFVDATCCRIALKPSGTDDVDPIDASIMPGGNFIMRNVVPGAWTVDIESLPEGSYVKSVRFGDKDVFHKELIADDSATGSLEVVIESQAAEITGYVKNAKSGRVLLAPAHDVEKSYLYYLTSIEPDGTFHIRNIPPGIYNLFAFRTLDDDAWLDPDFRSRIAGAAVPVELANGS